MEIERLEDTDLNQFENTINKIQQMTWDQVYKTASKSEKRGINWEPIDGQRTRTGKVVASIRISKKFRARVCRHGQTMRFISLHPDHDSAYEESGNENL
jgi:hypothetical protein